MRMLALTGKSVFLREGGLNSASSLMTVVRLFAYLFWLPLQSLDASKWVKPLDRLLWFHLLSRLAARACPIVATHLLTKGGATREAHSWALCIGGVGSLTITFIHGNVCHRIIDTNLSYLQTAKQVVHFYSDVSHTRKCSGLIKMGLKSGSLKLVQTMVKILSRSLAYTFKQTT